MWVVFTLWNPQVVLGVVSKKLPIQIHIIAYWTNHTAALALDIQDKLGYSLVDFDIYCRSGKNVNAAIHVNLLLRDLFEVIAW